MLENDTTNPNERPQPLTGEQKRALLKEQIKQEMLAQKVLEEKLLANQRLAKAKGALAQMEARLENLSGDGGIDQWINRLQEKSAVADAAIDLALGTQTTPIEASDSTRTLADLTDASVSETNDPKPSTPTQKTPTKTLGSEEA